VQTDFSYINRIRCTAHRDDSENKNCRYGLAYCLLQLVGAVQIVAQQSKRVFDGSEVEDDDNGEYRRDDHCADCSNEIRVPGLNVKQQRIASRV